MRSKVWDSRAVNERSYSWTQKTKTSTIGTGHLMIRVLGFDNRPFSAPFVVRLMRCLWSTHHLLSPLSLQFCTLCLVLLIDHYNRHPIRHSRFRIRFGFAFSTSFFPLLSTLEKRKNWHRILFSLKGTTTMPNYDVLQRFIDSWVKWFNTYSF